MRTQISRLLRSNESSNLALAQLLTRGMTSLYLGNVILLLHFKVQCVPRVPDALLRHKKLCKSSQ